MKTTTPVATRVGKTQRNDGRRGGMGSVVGAFALTRCARMLTQPSGGATNAALQSCVVAVPGVILASKDSVRGSWESCETHRQLSTCETLKAPVTRCTVTRLGLPRATRVGHCRDGSDRFGNAGPRGPVRERQRRSRHGATARGSRFITSDEALQSRWCSSRRRRSGLLT